MIRKRNPILDDRAIFHLIRRELIPLNPPELQKGNHSDQQLSERLKRGTALVWSYSSNTAAAAFILMYPIGSVLFADLLAVDRGLQGKGIGTLLLREAERFGRQQGMSRLQLYVNASNAKGIHFYQKKGMSIVRYDQYLKSYLMDKWIG